jgi:tRNA (cytidine/uridine-2'-O-)-methyltransferase
METTATTVGEFHIVLVEPEIPHNVGAVARLCVATRSTLHLVGRLGFHLDDASVRRAGLDYWRHVRLARHEDFAAFQRSVDAPLFLFSARGSADYASADFPSRAALVFGNESKGLPSAVRALAEPAYRIPIYDDRVRSLNLATAVGIVLYEAVRQRRRPGSPAP